MPPLDCGGLAFAGAGEEVLVGGGVCGGGVVVVGTGTDVDTVGWTRAATGIAGGAGARTVKVVLAWLRLAPAQITSR